MSSKKFYAFEDLQSDQIQRSSRKTFTTHYACRSAVLNLTLVTGTTNGFFFQIIGNSLIESFGVRLTCLDCKITVSCAVKGSKGWRSGEKARLPPVWPRFKSFNNALCGLSLLLVLSFAPRGFSPGTPVFPSPQKPTFSNSNSTRNQVVEEPLCGYATSKYYLFIYIYLYLSAFCANL